MNVCFKCGVSGDKVRLRDAISSKGIVKICEICASSEKLPIIKRVTEEQLAQAQTQRPIRDRLTGMNQSLMKKEVTLRDIIEKNVKSKIPLPSDLIENFHWTIQRIKRTRKITREEFAKAIGENEATIRLIEQGILPNNDYKLINKIENYLGVSLRKPGTSGFPDTSGTSPRRFVLDNSLIEKEQREEAPKKLSFNIPDSKQMRISDLKDMDKKKTIDTWEEEYSQDDEQFLDKQEEFDEED